MLETLKKQCHSKGINISMMINKFKKSQKERKALYEIPDTVYIEVCKTILAVKEVPDKPYPYFMKVLTLKSHEYFANKHQVENKRFKTDRGNPTLLRKIMEGIG